MRVSVPPLFGLRDSTGLYPHFTGQKGEEFAVNRVDLRRLNYNKIVFGRGSVTNHTGRAYNALPDPGVGVRTQRCLVLLLNWYHYFLDQSYALGFVQIR